MRFAVTGGSGNIAQKLISELLLNPSHEVVVLVRSAMDNHEWGNRAKCYSVDYQDTDLLRQYLEGVEVLFHLAFDKTIPLDEKPDGYIRDHSQIILNLLDAYRNIKKLKHFVFISTALVYGAENLAYQENHAVNPKGIYASVKLICEDICRVYASEKLKCDCVRLSNVYGGSIDYRTVHGSIFIQSGGDEIILRNLDAICNFIHIDDVASGLISLIGSLESESNFRIFNLGSSHPISILKFAEYVQKWWIRKGKRVEITQHPDWLPKRTLQSIDSSYIESVTGWSSKVRMEEGINHYLGNIYEE